MALKFDLLEAEIDWQTRSRHQKTEIEHSLFLSVSKTFHEPNPFYWNFLKMISRWTSITWLLLEPSQLKMDPQLADFSKHINSYISATFTGTELKLNLVVAESHSQVVLWAWLLFDISWDFRHRLVSRFDQNILKVRHESWWAICIVIRDFGL